MVVTGARGDNAPEFVPLGKKAEKKPEAPPIEWVPSGTPGIERNVKDKKLRTAIPLPPAAPK